MVAARSSVKRKGWRWQGVVVGLLVLGVAPSSDSFKVLWNSPWPSCCGAKAEKELLPLADPLPQFVEHNITVNTGFDKWSSCNGTDAVPCFNGYEVVTIYTEQIGLYPHYEQNGTTHEWVPVNGGLPQLVNMTAHLAAWAADVAAVIPDPGAAPIVGLDMEAWRVAWEGNDPRPMAEPAQAVVQNKSIELVRSRHPEWSEAQLLKEAKIQWAAGARSFWTETWRVAKQLRPRAAFGNYDFSHCGNWGCSDAMYWHWQKNAENAGFRPHTNLPPTQPTPRCPVPNANDDLGWLWQLLDVLEPTIYFSTNNISINNQFLDCALGEARRVAALAKPLRGGKRIPIYPYADALWNAEWGNAARSQYLNASALQSILMRAAMKHGVDGLFLWGAGFRGCAETWECKGNGTCSGGSCTDFTSYGTYVNTLLGPAVAKAVTAAAGCREARCHSHGRCNDCGEPFDEPSSWAMCDCDCDDGYAGDDCAS